jgi:histone deacetylase 1/2
MENLPLGRNAIGNKWVVKVKAKPNGSVDRFKARFVAQGFSQRAGVDYSETFSQVVKLNTLRTVLAIAAKRNMHMHSADIETAFLNANLQEEIYMRQPRGAKDGTPPVMRLMKSIYGPKKPRANGTSFSIKPSPPLDSSERHHTPTSTR